MQRRRPHAGGACTPSQTVPLSHWTLLERHTSCIIRCPWAEATPCRPPRRQASDSAKVTRATQEGTPQHLCRPQIDAQRRTGQWAHLGQPEHLAGPSQKHTAAPRALACPWSPADDFCTKRPHTPVAPRCATHARWRGCLSGQPNDARDVAIQRRLEPSGRCSTGRGIFATHRTRPGGACMHESLLACMQAPARSGAQPGWENSPRTERGCVQRAAQQARSGRGAKLGSMTHRTLRRCRRPRRSKLSTYVHKWLVRPSAVLRGAVLGMLGSVERIGHDRAAATEPLATKGS